MLCSFCNQPILIGHKVQVVPPISEYKIGPKSGQPYLQPEDSAEEVIHLECAPGFFDPEFNADTHDQLITRLRAEITDEEYELLKEAAKEEIAKMGDRLCSDCYEEIVDEEAA